ncbi:MAG TPA: hypothetical protein VMY77_07990 [Chitinophagaceae bacterium]|nr:hypothetical protein [Chitinophagaceae bacterium]
MLHTVRFIAFLILVPGFVIGYMPYWILSNYHKPVGISGWRYSGYIFLIGGGILFLSSIAEFFFMAKVHLLYGC